MKGSKARKYIEGLILPSLQYYFLVCFKISQMSQYIHKNEASSLFTLTYQSVIIYNYF